MQSNLISVKLRPGVSPTKVKEVFKQFNTQQITIHDNKAFIRLADANQLNVINVKYNKKYISQLDNAQISVLDKDFKVPTLQNQVTDQKLHQAQPEAKPQNSCFIVVENCDPAILNTMQQNLIDKLIFRTFKIGRVIKYKTNVFAEFLDPNEVETLQTKFPQFIVFGLGENATLSLVDANFNYEEKRKEADEFKKQEQLQEQIRTEEAEINTKKQSILKQLQEDTRASKQQKVFTIHPQGYQAYRKVKEQKTSAHSNMFMIAVIVAWGFFVLFT